MANAIIASPQEIAPGVTRKDYRWGWVLEGKKLALMAAGVGIEASWFATTPDSLGRVRRVKYLKAHGRNIRTDCLGKGLAFASVQFSHTADEIQQFNEREAKEQASGLPDLDADHATADQARNWMHLNAGIGFRLACGWRGWRLPEAGIQKLAVLRAQALHVISNARLVQVNGTRLATVLNFKPGALTRTTLAGNVAQIVHLGQARSMREQGRYGR